MGFRVRNINTGLVEPGIPTPALIERGYGEAFFFGSRAQHQSRSAEPEGVWYLRDATHEAEDGQYVRVRIEHTEPHRVDVHVRVVDDSADDSDDEVADAMEWDDYFIVEAASRSEAEELGRKAAADDAFERWGGRPEGVVVDILRVRPGVSM